MQGIDYLGIFSSSILDLEDDSEELSSSAASLNLCEVTIGSVSESFYLDLSLEI